MIGFVLRRAAESIVVLAVMSFVVYALIGLMPGDPIDLMLAGDPDMSAADVARLKAQYGLDQPIWDRYLAWAGNALEGDFGHSRVYSQPVLDILLPRLGNTVLLLGLSLILSLAIAIPLGVISAVRQYSWLDYMINLFAFGGISVPPFWLALMLMLVFSVMLQALPAAGMATVGDGGLWDRARHLILPVLTLTIASVGDFIRFMRGSMIEALSQDYVRTARAKGLPARRVVLGHAMRNALLPLTTVVALSFGALFSGALITETMFSWQGMGKTIYDAILGNDYNLALVGLLFATLTTLAGNLLADLAYGWLDPRISYDDGGPGA